MNFARKVSSWAFAITVGASLMLFARPVHATFPGKNGSVAYRVYADGQFQQNAIYPGVDAADVSRLSELRLRAGRFSRWSTK
jgi:hypothetical protein